MEYTEVHTSYLVKIHHSQCHCSWFTFSDFKKAYYHYLKIFNQHANVELVKETHIIQETKSETIIK